MKTAEEILDQAWPGFHLLTASGRLQAIHAMKLYGKEVANETKKQASECAMSTLGKANIESLDVNKIVK